MPEYCHGPARPARHVRVVVEYRTIFGFPKVFTVDIHRAIHETFINAWNQRVVGPDPPQSVVS